MDTSSDLNDNLDRLFGKYAIPISEISAETWLYGICKVYNPYWVPRVPNLFIPIIDLVKEKLGAETPRFPIKFDRGLGINTAVCACLVHESYDGRVIQQSPYIREYTKTDFLLLLKPSVDDYGPLKWASWHLVYKQTEVGRFGAAKIIEKTVQESIVASLDRQTVLEWFSKWPQVPLRFFEVAHKKIKPFVQELRHDADMLESLGDDAWAAYIHVKQ